MNDFIKNLTPTNDVDSPLYRDSDQLYDDMVISEINIKVLGTGKLAISGNTGTLYNALDMLGSAIDAAHLRSYPAHRTFQPALTSLNHTNTIVHEIQLKYRRNGAMSTAGLTDNKEYNIALFQQAIDLLKKNHSRIDKNTNIIIPSKDVYLPGVKI